MICAISIGAAVTSQTRCPWSRCSWARARVPGQIRCAIASSKISSPSSSSSRTVWPSMKLSAEARVSRDVLRVLDADHAEVGLLPHRAEDVAGREEVSAGADLEQGGRCSRPASPCCPRRRRPPTSCPPECPAPSRPRPRRPPPRPPGPTAGAGSGACAGARAGGSPGQGMGSRMPPPSPRPLRRMRPMPPAHDLTALVRDAASEQSEKLAVVESGGRSLTWSQLEDDVRRIATGLGERGIVAGHRVMIATGNRIEFVTTYLGVLRAQAVAVPVNPGRHVVRAGPDDRRLRVAAGGRRRDDRRRGPRGDRDCSRRPRRGSRRGGTRTCSPGRCRPGW